MVRAQARVLRARAVLGDDCSAHTDGGSSIGRAVDSKSTGCGFKSLPPCSLPFFLPACPASLRRRASLGSVEMTIPDPSAVLVPALLANGQGRTRRVST